MSSVFRGFFLLSLSHTHSPCAPLLDRAAAISRPMPLGIFHGNLLKKKKRVGEQKNRREKKYNLLFLSLSSLPVFTSWDLSRCRSAPRWARQSRRWRALSGGGGAGLRSFWSRCCFGRRGEGENRRRGRRDGGRRRRGKTARCDCSAPVRLLLSSPGFPFFLSLLFSKRHAPESALRHRS